jgi:hypothetical protein
MRCDALLEARPDGGFAPTPVEEELLVSPQKIVDTRFRQ